MDSDIKKPTKQEVDTSGLDAARDELLSAVEAGTIREGKAEDGLEHTSGFSNNLVLEDNEGLSALSSTANIETSSNKSLLVEEEVQSTRKPLIDISNLPTEHSRNQNIKDNYPSSNVRIEKSQSSKIRNTKLEKEGMSRKKHKSPLHFVIAIIGILFVVLALIFAGAFAWYKSQLSPTCPDCKQEIVGISINSGSGSAEIADLLEKEGLIKSAFAFRVYVKLNNIGDKLQAGAYEIEKSADVPAIAKQLCDGAKARTKSITFLPGGTIMDAKNRLLALGFGEAEIDAAFNKQYDSPLFNGRPTDTNIEGYIYGDTYEVYANASVEDILTQTVFPEMLRVVEQNNLEAKFKAQGLTLYEGIKLSSIVQKEAGHLVDDMPAIAGVFYNRLKNNQVLGSDAIIGYRADQLNPNRDRSDLSYLTTITCPWNSRRCQGLPPTPISTPGKNALVATAEPASHNYFYFLTGDDDKTYYATSQAEHDANAKEHCKVRCGYM